MRVAMLVSSLLLAAVFMPLLRKSAEGRTRVSRANEGKIRGEGVAGASMGTHTGRTETRYESVR